MIQLNTSHAARLAGGRIEGEDRDYQITSVVVDSRKARAGSLFFALKGQSTDGHKFLADAYSNGARVAVTSEVDPSFEGCQIVVQDTFEALQNMARGYMEMFDLPVLAVTGSSGKTTTKDILSSALSLKYNVAKTQGNLNSSTGVPLSVFNLDMGHTIAVFEVSMSAPGEILGNVKIIKPTTALITNIGVAHMEQLGSRQGIFNAKMEIASYLTTGDCLIVNADDPFLASISGKPYQVVGAGVNNGSLQAFDVSFEGGVSNFKVMVDGKARQFRFALPGMHMVSNCLLAIAACLRHGLEPEQIQAGLDLYSPGEKRMEIEEKSGVKLINDTYNANPDSMKAAIDSLVASTSNKAILVIGDMYELGPEGPSLANGVGKYAASRSISHLFAIGDMANDYIDGFNEANGSGQAVVFSSYTGLAEELLSIISKGDAILFKASRGVALEKAYMVAREYFA
ncbi:MAG: UDP-N-acetylmuramoyl-tripeptide--D-alanyl-D-alanine ligase [Eubacteriaceae bacterium]|nr:UDP-N-acetylmuramoyl-tripeptide--D-alanyl-D-alanine ligase [Eubacteriaceae bacterium]